MHFFNKAISATNFQKSFGFQTLIRNKSRIKFNDIITLLTNSRLQSNHFLMCFATMP